MAKIPKITCPECGSLGARIVRYRGIDCVVCNSCGFDEREVVDVFPEQRVSQREKSRYTPYKKGGAFRTQKRTTK
jgi:uncharacterized Zn finger protein